MEQRREESVGECEKRGEGGRRIEKERWQTQSNGYEDTKRREREEEGSNVSIQGGT